MFKNYIKIAFRNLRRHKGYSLINILGLAVGITACILILLFVQDELSYDQFHVKKDRIYRVTREWFNTDGTTSLHLARIAPPIGPLLKNDFPDGIRDMVRIHSDYNTLLRVGDHQFIENGFRWAGKSFFHIFTYPLLRGDPTTALAEPNSVVLTRSVAEKLFGSVDAAMGKTINYEKERDLLVTGVTVNVPENTHFKFKYLGSLQTLVDKWGEKYFRTDWGSNNYATYLLLAKNFSAATLQKQIPQFLDVHLTQRSMDAQGHAPEFQPSKTTMLHLQKLTDIHLHSHLNSEWEANGDIKNIYLFVAIAFFILLIACINFMNLATARSAKRMKEIGMRKVLGAQRKQVISQFLGESVFISFLALLVGIGLAKATLPYFNNFVGKNLTLHLTADPALILILSALTLFVGILAGSYPALYLSGFHPLSVIKSVSKMHSNRSVFRRVLVVAQFTISIALIICMGIIYSQFKYEMNKNLGYNKDHVVILRGDQNISENLETVKNRLLENPNIVSVTSSRLVPTDNLVNNWGGRRLDGEQSEPLGFRLAVQECDYDFFDTYRMKIIAGRDFSREYATDDSSAFILNESAVAKLGWGTPDNAIGKSLEYGNRTGKIVGVVKDFNFESLHNTIVPIIFLIGLDRNYQISVRIRSKNIHATIHFIGNLWKKLRPDYPFEYHFLDDQYRSLYQSEIRLGQVFGVFSILAIFIACLGLLGLVSFAAEQKTKEIGIRKVLGASVSKIVFLLTREFSKWVLLSNIIAWPLAWFAMHKWLENFAYRIDLTVWPFLLAGIAALIIALLTVSWQAIRAATADPVDALRYE